MAKITLSESNFKLIAEGVTVFKVVEVDDTDYDDFGILNVKLQTAQGETHNERFTLRKNDNELNEGALRAWSYFARTCLNNYQADEIDTQDIVGCYIRATVKHEPYMKKDGKPGTAVRLNDYEASGGFEKKAEPEKKDVNIDEFLNG